MTVQIALFGERRNRLGESPLWDWRTQQLWWIDSVADLICRADADGGNLATWTAPSHVGSIVLATSGLLAACADGFYAVDTDCGLFTPLALPEAGNAAVRFNDGKADRQGRFLSGTMRTGPDDDRPARLYRLETDGRVTILERDFGLANATCFSPDGLTLYFGDSLQGVIWAYDYADDGSISNRRTFLDTAPLGSAPDGATVDAEGYLWVALVQAQQMARVSPSGEVVARIDVPVPHPSCPAFGGPDMRTMFVTTLNTGTLSTDHPEGGRMLAITGLGVTGIPEPICEVPRP